jgi:SPP1 family predicted phage head-tail adaptor
VTEPCLMELNKRLIIERPVHSLDDGGSTVISWQQTGIVWAALRTIGARRGEHRQTAAQGDLSLHVTHEIWLRYRPELTGAMRFRMGLRLFLIQSIRDPDERQRWLACLTDERRP